MEIRSVVPQTGWHILCYHLRIEQLICNPDRHFPLPLGRDSKCSFDRNAAEPQPNPSIRSDLTEGNDGNEEPGQKLRLFVSFVTFCKNSEF